MRGISKKWLAATLVAGLAATALVGPSASAKRPNKLEGKGEGLKLIANIPWEGGTDMEFATIKGRDYAFAGSEAGTTAKGGGLHVVDITNPAKPKEVAHLKCAMSQADIQISYDQKTLIMAADSAGGPEACLATTRLGFMTVDIRNPKMITFRRAFVRLCVRSKMRSLTIPPRKSPQVPPRNTPDANSAELLNFRL